MALVCMSFILFFFFGVVVVDVGCVDVSLLGVVGVGYVDYVGIVGIYVVDTVVVIVLLLMSPTVLLYTRSFYVVDRC